MASIRQNGYYNDPSIGAAFGNLAQAFAPPSGADAAGYSQAALLQQKKAQLADFFAHATAAGATPDDIDRYGVASGSFQPNQTYMSVNKANETSRLNNTDDNARAIQQTNLQQAGDTTRKLLDPVGEGQTRFVPPSLADQFKVDPTQRGVVKLNPGELASQPGGPVLQGKAKPLSETELKAKILGSQPDDVQAAAALSDIPVEPVVGPDGQPTYARRSDAVGKPATPKGGFSVTTNPDGTVSVQSGGTGANGKQTESQAKNALFGVRAAQGSATMDEMLNSDYGKSLSTLTPQNGVDYVAGMSRTDSPFMQLLQNASKSDEGRKYYQGAQNFLGTIIRPDSGAAVQPSEFSAYGQIYIPMPGDDAATVQKKNEARHTATLALQSLSNGGASTIANQMATAGLPVPEELQHYLKALPAGGAPLTPSPVTPTPAPADATAAPTPGGTVQWVIKNGQLVPAQ